MPASPATPKKNNNVRHLSYLDTRIIWCQNWLTFLFGRSLIASTMQELKIYYLESKIEISSWALSRKMQSCLQFSDESGFKHNILSFWLSEWVKNL